MIFSASLSVYVKKALRDKSFQTSVTKMAELLPIDPKVSNMDAIIISPKDLGGMLGRQLIEAISKKHPNVGVIYIYTDEKDSQILRGDIYKKQERKITVDTINDAVASILDVKTINDNNVVVESQDKKNLSFAKIPIKRSLVDPTEETDEITKPEVEFKEDITAESDNVPQLELPRAEEQVAVSLEKTEVSRANMTLEQRIIRCAEFADWGLFKKSLEKDAVLRDIMNENTQYAGAVNMLEVLDNQIYNIFRDPHKTAEDKFSDIREIGVNRSSYAATKNNIVVEKICNIMAAIVSSAQDTVDSRVESVRKSLDTLVTSKLSFQDQDKLRSIITERMEIQTYLLELAEDIISVYKTMDESVNDLIINMDENLPSSNAYINEVLKPQSMSGLFTPQNAQALASKLMRDLQSHRISMSVLENKVQEVVGLVFKLCEADGTIIQYQQKWIDLLKAQRVEDVVIVDTLIKNVLRIFIGPSDVGRTATTLTWCGILSRRQNTLLIDLSGGSKFSDYGVDPIPLDDFMNTVIQDQFTVVSGTINDLERLDEIIGELKLRLNYYPHINIVLDVAQVDLLNRLSDSALAVNFVSDCTPRSISQMRNCISAFTAENIARKVLIIDPAIDPLTILSSLTADPLGTKLITIPYIKYIKACSLKGMKPYESREVITIFEEAMK